MRPVNGKLVENRIVVWNIEDSRRLYQEGFYGKPLGIPKPKGADFNAPLILDLIEGYYLAKGKRLKIVDAVTSQPVKLDKIEEICKEQYVDFEEKFLVYKECRDAHYVVTPGIKFGCDFAVYEHGPGLDHAPFLVQVAKPSEKATATGIVLSGRLATTVRKQFIVAVADSAKKKVSYLAFDWWRA
ncbi:MAG: tRNA-intron lyase [Thaumarchaeota archaeon]|nr:tRNA-intron lyase [Nitrososphaerota archaeon]